MGYEFLYQDIQYIKGVGEARAKMFHTLGVHTVFDMLTFFPRDYEDRTMVKDIADCRIDDLVCVKAFAETVPREMRIRKGFSLYKWIVSDGTGRMEVTLFNQKFLASTIRMGQEYIFYGKIGAGSGGRLQMASPEIEPAELQGRLTCAIVPKYNLTAGLSYKVCVSVIRNCLQYAQGQIPEIVPPALRQNYQLCEINFALENIHFPASGHDLAVARRRLVFEEFYLMSLGLQNLKNGREELSGEAFTDTGSVEDFISSLPFALTGAQKRVVDEITHDLSGSKVMNRLVQGDVGSGKTVVAACAVFAARQSGYQSVLMAPTEILARQHYESFAGFFHTLPIRIVLLVGSMTKKQKNVVLEQIQNGEADLVIGTHAVIEDTVVFHKLGLVITDEQHRFGVRQRAVLTQKGTAPHMLVMTATPIPRTLALTLYGDLDISVIDELPPGRQQIKTYAVGERMRPRIYRFLRNELDAGRQAYVVCPLVDASDKLEAAAATEFMENLSKTELAGYPVALIHGKMKNKDEIMEGFLSGKTKVLISTTVIEVGVNVPNATIMMIENAERFGLSQLHQLRGRVGRGSHQSYCVLFCQGHSEIARERMKIMCQTNDGFLISQKDMELRGPGEFFGTRQHGLPELKIANLFTDGPVLQDAQRAASDTLQNDKFLESEEHIYLKERLRRFFSYFSTDLSFN